MDIVNDKMEASMMTFRYLVEFKGGLLDAAAVASGRLDTNAFLSWLPEI